MREEATETRTVPSFGFTERGRRASPGCPEERPGVKNGLEAHVEAVRCILMPSRESKTEIPVDAPALAFWCEVRQEVPLGLVAGRFGVVKD